MKKRICVVTSYIPFVYGGNEVLAENLSKKLREFGFESTVAYIPQNPFGKQISAYLSARFTDLHFGGYDNEIDQIISLKFPAYAVRHKNHVCWLSHRMREYYDLWDDFYSHLPSASYRIKEKIRRFAIQRLDDHFLKNGMKKVCAISENSSMRLRRWGEIEAEVVYPPPRDMGYRDGPYEKFILSISRLTKYKRHNIFIDAFNFIKDKSIKGYIIGEGEERRELEKQIEKADLKDRVFLLGYISNEALEKYYSHSLGVFFGPYDEDLGFVTLESMKFRRPVITCTDSGGPLEFVKDRETGFVVSPDPGEIADRIEYLLSNEGLAESMGKSAFERIKDITWERVIEKLVII
ncbi:MAG: glycosyltransferase family 4 protein [Nitrospirota bacterium]